MTTDRELLEAAAKVAGLHPLCDWDEETGCIKYPFRSDVTNMHLWNPLTDDGDALLLAAKLHACVAINRAARPDERGGTTVLFYWAPNCWAAEWHDEHPDVATATRRAIVRAAAALQDEAAKTAA